MRLRSFRAFVLSLLPVLFLITLQSVYAINPLPVGADPPSCQTCGECGNGGCSDNRISSASGSSISMTEGNLRNSYAVVRLKSAFGATIDFSLHYNSYNADNSRAAIDTGMGYGWTHSYNIFLFSQSGHMFRMGGDGRVTRYRRNPDDTFTTATGYFETLVQTSGSTFTITTKDKTVFTFALIPNTPFSVGDGPVYRLTSVVDRNNNVTGLAYTDGNLKSITDTYGRSLTLFYNSRHKLISVSDPLARTTTLRYDAAGRQLLRIIDPAGKSIRHSYNSLYQLTGKVDKDGRAFSYLYENQKPVAIQDGAGAIMFRLTNSQNWATDPNALSLNQVRVYIPATTILTDGRGKRWRYGYDTNGYITSIVAPDGTTTKYTYDPATLMIASKSDANRHTTRYVYDTLGNLTEMTDALGHVTTSTYEPVFSQMTGMTDPNGRMTSYEYDSRGNRTRETDPLSNTQDWTYDVHGNALTAKDKNGNLTRYDLDSFGNRIMMTDAVGTPAQRFFIMTYDVVGNDLSLADTNNHSIWMAYDSLDRLTDEIDQHARLTKTSYDGMGNRIKVIDRNGKITSYQYDLRQRLVKTTDALGQMTTQTYDGNNNLISTTDKNGHSTTIEYDMRNRQFRMTDALNNRTTRAYDRVGNTRAETDANGHSTRFEYDELNRPAKITNGAGEVTRYVYDVVGLSGCSECTGPTLGTRLITKRIDGNGKVTYLKYDGLDRQILEIRKEGDTADMIDPSDAVTRHTFDANSNQRSLTEPNGDTTTFDFDELDRLVRQTNAAGDKTINTYDGADNLITRTDPNLNVTTHTYDASDRLIRVDDRLGRVASYTFDHEGNGLSETDGNDNTTNYLYDDIYRVVKVTDPSGKKTQSQFDPVGNLLKVTDRNGKTTTYLYDDINRRISMTNALGHTTRYEYDRAGNQLKIIDAKPTPGVMQYKYDGVNRIIKETYPDPPPNMRTFTYDLVGNVKTRTDQKGQTTTYNYNDLYFLLNRDYPVSADDHMTYDLSGRTLSAERGGWLVKLKYDGSDRVTMSTQNGRTVNYVYDIPGRKRALTYPGGRGITEETDFRDRTTKINDTGSPQPIVQYSYDPGDRATSRAYRNGTTVNYTYNANDWMLSLEHSKGASRIAGFGHTYDNEGNKLSEENRHNAPCSESYKYDAAYRLIDYKVARRVDTTATVSATPLVNSAICGSGTQTAYDLDEAGNWKSKVTDGRTQTRTHNAVNEITSIAAVPLTYDDNGNLIEDQLYSYAYDEEDRLILATRKWDNHVVGVYQYDALGRRVLKVADPSGVPTTTRYFHDDERIIEEQSGTGVTQATYVYGESIDEILTMNRGGQTYYYHQNALWSVAAVTDSAASVVERYAYDPYGKVTITDGAGNPRGSISAIKNPWMFTGRRLDEETGFYDYRTRYLDPSIGRFLTRDTIGVWEDESDLGNGYAYVGNNPSSYIDPSGTCRSRAERKADRKERRADRKERRANRKEKVADKKAAKGRTKAAARLRRRAKTLYMKADNLRWEADTLRAFDKVKYGGRSRVRRCGRCWADPIGKDFIMLNWELKEKRQPMADNGFEIVIEVVNWINWMVDDTISLSVPAGASSYYLYPLYEDTRYQIGLNGWNANGGKVKVCKVSVRTNPN
jgi:RHS repeat-associated protein